jgi:ligand-binding sensor domain-containing protein
MLSRRIHSEITQSLWQKSCSQLSRVMSRSLRSLLGYTLIILGLTACQPEEIIPPKWQWERAETGLPRQAIFLAVAADPLDPAHLWGGYYAAGSLATSHDGGQTWTTGAQGLTVDNPVFDLLPGLTSISNQAEVELWAATRDGLLLSTDAGISWQPVTTGLPLVTAFALAIDAEGRLYVGLEEGGVYAQAHDGAGWESLAEAGSRLASVAVISLAVSPDGQYLFAGTSGQGVFASQDGGQTWVNTYQGKYTPDIAVNPTHPTQAIASLREQTVEDDFLARLIEDLSTKDRLVRTSDGGQSWHTLPLAWASDQVTSLLWLADGTLGAGTSKGQLFRSQDGGDTWQQGGAGLPVGGILDLTVAGALADPTRLLAATWTGLYASDDGGQNWANLAPTVGVPNVHALLSTETGVLLGTRTGLFCWQPDTRSWTTLADDLPSSGATSLAADPVDKQRLYVGTGGDGVYRSDDAGESWQRLPLIVGVPDLVVDPKDARHLYLLAAWERVYESQDGGQTWYANWQGLGDVIETVSLAIDPVKPIAYVGTEAGLYRSRKGENWQRVAPALGDQSILALLPQTVPTTFWNNSVLYIGTTRGAYRSFDHGYSVQGPTDDPGWGHGLEEVSVTAFLIDPDEPRLLYAGTAYNGVYQSVDGGETWQPIGPTNLAEEVIEAMAWGLEGELFIVTINEVWLGEKL